MEHHEHPGQGKYLSLTSYRRDGTPVATPVWFVTENGRLLVSTDAGSYKVKRIRRNPVVSIAACTASGRLRGEPVEARAEILPDGDGPHVDELMKRKYRVDRVLVLPLYRAVMRLRGKQQAAGKPAYLAITPLP